MFRNQWHMVAIGLLGGILSACTTVETATPPRAPAIDNSSIGQPEFRPHVATYGLVYKLPASVNAELDAKVKRRLMTRLGELGLTAEEQTFNLPHITVVHIHNADPSTPQKMLKALPKPPPPLNITLENFYTTEAAKGAGQPWWFDLGVIKAGHGYENMMAYNLRATAALTPLRDGPLPRCTGPVYARMSDAAKDLVKTVGVSGVNVMKDGVELKSYNPHTTLVYSTTPFSDRIHTSLTELAGEFNSILPHGIDVTLKDVSIVEIGFAGNVLREFYRISLENGSAIDVATGRQVAVGSK